MEYFLALLIKYKYAVFLPLAIFEGPIITVVGGFLVTLGVFDAIWVYLLSVVGDIIGDSFYYYLGLWGGTRAVNKFGKYVGLTQNHVDKARSFFHNHRKKAIGFSKLVSGVGTAGLFVAGILEIPYWQFIRICIPVTVVQYAVWLTIGILFGHAYAKISIYINYWGTATIILGLGILVYLAFKFIKKEAEKII